MNNIHSPQQLANDQQWQQKLEEVVIKYGIEESDIYDIIYGETVPKWNFASYNAGSKAAGAFQFIPVTIQTLNKRYDMKLNVSKILKMTPAQQLDLYDKYLQLWNYDGTVALGFMQAAPGKFYKLKRQGVDITPDLVVYSKGSRAWRANPGWRLNGDGDATIESINQYYASKRRQYS